MNCFRWHKATLVVGLILLFASPVFAASQKVVVMSTGGTIAGSLREGASGGYDAGKRGLSELLDELKEVPGLPALEGEEVFKMASQDLTPAQWLKLAKRVQHHLKRKDVMGAVITHGTDTLEETAFFLDLVHQSDKPVIIVGSMRPPGSLGADGARNLTDALRVAQSPEARGRGALIILHRTIHSARWATKTNATTLDSFVSREAGPLGRIEREKPIFFSPPQKLKPLVKSLATLKTLPKVEILYGFAGNDGTLVSAAQKAGAKGIVWAGTGNGNLSAPALKATQKARKKGVIIVRAARTGSGFVSRHMELDDDALKFVASGYLNAQKARVALILALSTTHDWKKIQAIYDGINKR